MRLAVAQLSFPNEDIANNLSKMMAAYDIAERNKCDVVIFSELCITGYNSRDMFLRRDFRLQASSAQDKFMQHIKRGKCVAIFGNVQEEPDVNDGCATIYNAGVVADRGGVMCKHTKSCLPNYDVFDEERVFSAGQNKISSFCVNDVKIGLTICEDLWKLRECSSDLDLIIALNASPFTQTKISERRAMAVKASKITNASIIYSNVVGGQGDIMFDGSSFVYSALKQEDDAELRHCVEDEYEFLSWGEEIRVYDFERKNGYFKFIRSISGETLQDLMRAVQCSILPFRGIHKNMLQGVEDDMECANLYIGAMRGLYDYYMRHSFDKALIALSGGIDSALVAAIACDSLGAENVMCIHMPSRYTSGASSLYAEFIARNLGCAFQTISIEPYHKIMVRNLGQCIAPLNDGDVARENLQARLRGTIIMTLSNQMKGLVLCASNKSESAVGYATLYGDMCGGVAPIADIYKTDVYRIARWRNDMQRRNCMLFENDYDNAVIPEEVIDRAPSAELRYDQRDSDSLPDYEILDKILQCYMEKCMSIERIHKDEKIDLHLIERVIKMWRASEFKRKQAPLAFRLSASSMYNDRRYTM